MSLFFFFTSRRRHTRFALVTGVQTCALPIFLVHSPRAGHHIAGWLMQQAADWRGEILCISAAAANPFAPFANARIRVAPRPDERAEERRGRDRGVSTCRSRWAPSD